MNPSLIAVTIAAVDRCREFFAIVGGDPFGESGEITVEPFVGDTLDRSGELGGTGVGDLGRELAMEEARDALQFFEHEQDLVGGLGVENNWWCRHGLTHRCSGLCS